MARILIVGGGCRGRRLAERMVGEGHAVRITTRTEAGRADIERAGAEAWIGTPDRLATLRGALDGVAVLCWLLATASGPQEELRALHTTRVEYFMTQAIDTTVRGIVYESGGPEGSQGLAADGEPLARALVDRNVIPARFLRTDPSERQEWTAEVLAAVHSLLQSS